MNFRMSSSQAVTLVVAVNVAATLAQVPPAHRLTPATASLAAGVSAFALMHHG